MEESLLTTENPNIIKLADGKDYELPVWDLTTIANVEETIGFSLSKLQAKLNEKTAGTIRLIIYALLKEKGSKLSLEETGRLINFDQMKSVSALISKILAIAG